MNLYSKEIEMAVLGHLLVVPVSYDKASQYLKPEIFYFEPYQQIFKIIHDLNREGKTADMAAVQHVWHQDPATLTEVAHRAINVANIEEKCLILIQLYFSRELKKAGEELYRVSEETDSIELLEKTQRKIEELWSIILHLKETNLAELTKKTMDEYEASKKSGVTGIRSGFAEVDELTLGRNKGELVILAGRPSHGKSTYALNEAYYVAKNYPVAVFSLEMPATQLLKKIISSDSQVPLELIRKGNTSDYQDEQMKKSVKNILNLENKLFLYDIASIHIHDIVSIVKKLKRIRGIEVVYVDYLQLVHGDREKGASRDQEIGTISGGLKKLAMDLNICVVALSQLNREVEQRGDKRPQLSDLRESGNIEQDADIVQTIFRPEMYGIETIKIKGQEKDSRGIAEIVIHKNRNGKVGSAYMNFRGEISTLKSYVSEEFYSTENSF